MKNIFKINFITYFIILSAFLCGYFNYVIIITSIILFHDLGHILFMKLYKIKVQKIEILPFGSIILSDINYNLKSTHMLLISLAGILFQLILYIVFYYLFYFGFINNISYDIFLFFNKTLIIFNLLPIIPLDGSKILISLLEMLVSFKLALKITNIISLFTIIIFIAFNNINFNLILLSVYLLFKTYVEIKEHKLIYNKFLLERYIHKYNYKKIKNINHINRIHKNKFNFINNTSEYKILSKKFNYV